MIKLLLPVGIHETFNDLHDLGHSRPILMFVCPHALYKVYNFRTPLFAQATDGRPETHGSDEFRK